MQFPSELKPALWGAVGGAIALAIVGFSWGGWMTSSAAAKLADARADAAVVVALTPICVAKFRADTDATTKLAALKALSASWEQGNFIEKGGWATRDGATSPDYQLARACAEKLAQAKTASQ
jgi:pimeloyl-ACP methyl ester carboxylesterase